MLRSTALLPANRNLRRTVFLGLFFGLILIILFGSPFQGRSKRSSHLSQREKEELSLPKISDPHNVLQNDVSAVQAGTLIGSQPPSHGAALSETELAKAINLMDDILQTHTLTIHLYSELKGPGERFLRDLAERSRLFKGAFDVWDKIHKHTSAKAIIPRLKNLKTLAAEDAVNVYDEFRLFVGRLGARLFPWTFSFNADLLALKESFSGRGIVLSGGDKMVASLRTLILSLRKLDCNLPIELMYLGDDDLSVKHQHEFAKMPGVVTRDLSLVVDLESWDVNGWAVKPYALLMSSFREVMFIDADSYFLRNPDMVFEMAEFQQTGTVFFKDRHLFWSDAPELLKAILPEPVSPQLTGDNRIWDGSSEHMQESGVVVIDKVRHFVPMLVVARLNGPDRDGDENEGTVGIYDTFQGDKETFWLGWEMAGSADYAFHPMAVGAMGQVEQVKGRGKGSRGDANYTVCASQILHFDASNKPLWFNGGLKENKFDEDAGWRKFEGYVREPKTEVARLMDPFWDIHEANVLCLKAEQYYEFSAEETRSLDMLLRLAKYSEQWAKSLESAALVG